MESRSDSRARVRVSRLALGTDNFGKRWAQGAERAEAKKVFDAYVEAGGNFIDSADSYQFGGSEEIVGGFIASAK
jgi:aryl-alcohol dehydrogenase-like predicted oxidoreductase